MKVRIQKVIAASGITSRRKAEELIQQGKVTLNGKVVWEMGTCVDPQKDHIKVNGERSEERRVGKECRSRWSP